jgi:hypothetical protein
LLFGNVAFDEFKALLPKFAGVAVHVFSYSRFQVAHWGQGCFRIAKVAKKKETGKSKDLGFFNQTLANGEMMGLYRMMDD